MGRGNPRVLGFLVVLTIAGFSIIALNEAGGFPDISGTFDVQFPDFTVATLPTLPSLEFTSFPVDPATGQIIGNIVLGKPDRSGIVESVDGNCFEFESKSQGTNFPMSFGRSISPTKCYYGFASWDLSAIPDSFKYTRATFSINPQKFFPDVNAGAFVDCFWGLLWTPIDDTPTSQIIGKMSGVPTPSDPRNFILTEKQTGTGTGKTTWARLGGNCGSNGITSQGIQPNLDSRGFDFQPASALLTRALTTAGGDELTMFVAISSVGRQTTGCCWEQDQTWWEQSGAVHIRGTSQPIICGIGFHLVGFQCEPLNCTAGFVAGGAGGNECVPLVCPTGQQVNLMENKCEVITCAIGQQLVGNQCEQIICPLGENLIGSTCTPILCSVGEELIGNNCQRINCAIGTQLIGSSCQPIQCALGTELSGNNCVEIFCAVGQNLIGNDCVDISCPLGNELIGNDCKVIQCSTGTELVGNECKGITCPLGTNLEGNDCNKIFCATGTFLSGNTCEQITCDSGEILVGDICKPVECQIGERLVGSTCEQITCEIGSELIGNECTGINCLATEELQGNSCVKIPLNCPEGTTERENVCIQVVPTLMATGAPVSFLTLLGLSMFIIGISGIVVRSIRLKGF
jgi:hypothetical protein